MATSSPAVHGTAGHDDHHHMHPPPVVPSAKMHTGLIGMLFFIGSEIALFGSFFMAYFFIRVVQASDFESWNEAFGHAIPLDVALVNTVFLLTSSVTLHFALNGVKKDNRRQIIGWLIPTIVLGSIFLGVQIWEYANLISHEHIGPSTNAYSSVFFSLTGLHGSHVLVGLILLSIVLVRSIRGHYSSEHHIGFEAMGIYWHFVDVVWIFVVSLIYLPGNWHKLVEMFGGG